MLFDFDLNQTVPYCSQKCKFFDLLDAVVSRMQLQFENLENPKTAAIATLLTIARKQKYKFMDLRDAVVVRMQLQFENLENPKTAAIAVNYCTEIETVKQ